MNTGYRWLKVNNFLYVYTSTTLTKGEYFSTPHTEILAYVQQTNTQGEYRALRAGSVHMPIPFGSLVDMIIKVEDTILNERIKDFQSLNNSDLIEEGLQN